MQSLGDSTLSPLLPVAMLIGSVLLFLMLGFVGLILGRSAFQGLNFLQIGTNSWTWKYQLLKFWEVFHHTNFESYVGMWRYRIFVPISFATLILSLVMVCSRTARRSVGMWISLLVVMSLAFLASMAVIIQSSVVSAYGGLGLAHGITGPSILAAILSLLLLGISIIGIIQSRRTRSRKR